MNELTHEVNYNLAVENAHLIQLLKDIKPELQARIDGLQKLWPGAEVLTILHRNEMLMFQLDNFVSSETNR